MKIDMSEGKWINPEDAANESSHNHAAIDNGIPCGCYFCLSVFDGGEISKWTDEGTTAVCPICGVDAVLPGVTDMEILGAAMERFFCGSRGEGVAIESPLNG